MSSNHIQNVAIVGASGQVGNFIVEELLKTGKHKVTALTRGDSTSAMPSGVTVKKINYDDQSTIVAALQDIQVFIITMSVLAHRDSTSKLIEAAAAAGVPWVMPNEWGCDSTSAGLMSDILIGQAILNHRALIEKLGKSSWVGIACGFWYEYSLSRSPVMYGFDFKDRAVTLYDEGTTKINTSTWRQVGLAVARLLSLKIEPESADDKSPTLSQFHNKPVYISSFLASQKDMLASVLRVTSTSEKDWKINYEPSKERFEAGKQGFFQKGERLDFGKMLYARVFYPDGSGDFESKHGLSNGVLGLPEEDIDEATKVAISFAEEAQAH